MAKTLILNYNKLKPLAVGFTTGKDLLGWIIRNTTKGDCSHSLLITEDRGQKFATEETINGLQENSLEKYKKPSNRIVHMLYWTGWNDIVRANEAQDYLAYIRRKNDDESKYDPIGLLSFWFPKWIKPDPNKQWCSENGLSIHDKFGFKSNWQGRPASPAQLYQLMKVRSDVINIPDYYLA